MLRAFRPVRLAAPAVAAAVALAAAPQAAADVVVFDSNGFEAPSYSAGTIFNQQGFQVLPTPNAGMIQSGTVMSGSQAFQIVGAQLQSTGQQYGDGNFFYKSYGFGAGVNPVASGNPFVHLSFDGRVSGALINGAPNPSDIPEGGPYMEVYTPFGLQQALSPILLNINGGITVFTNAATGGSDTVISTADGLIPRETWVHVEAVFDFNAQKFRVLLNGTPVTFTEGAFSGADVPFRNTFGTSQSVAELGFQGYYNGQFNPTFNNMYFDNLLINATPSPVPEPSSFALGGLALAGLVVRLRRRKAARR